MMHIIQIYLCAICGTLDMAILVGCIVQIFHMLIVIPRPIYDLNMSSVEINLLKAVVNQAYKLHDFILVIFPYLLLIV